MADVGNLTAKLTLNTEGFEKGAESAMGMASKLAGGLGKALGGIATVAAGAVAAAGAGIAAITQQAVASYADYEQLVGGVETLFKESAGIVQDYAMQAYKTAGISANEYMETVTSFSASLLQSLGGDTEAAAEMANQAITDMADNANKMGSTMESIQNAYQGFAKGQYQLLDNLKLGYGGTATEMQRLLEDAEKISGIHYDISSYADVVEAIHQIQTQMGITGTTALEAEKTVTGSLNMVKASWKDLLTSVAGGGKGMHEAITSFVDSVKTFAGNVIPVVQEALWGIGDLVKELAPVIMDAVPDLIANVLPGLIEAAVGLVDAIINALPQIMGVLQAAIPTIVGNLINVTSSLLMMLFTTGLPMLLNLAMQILQTISYGLAENLPVLIPAMVQMVGYMINTIVQNLPQFLYMGAEIVFSIVKGIIMAIPNFFTAIGELLGIVDHTEKSVASTTANIQNSLNSTNIAVSDFSKKSQESTAVAAKDILKNTEATRDRVSGALTGLERAFTNAAQVSRQYFYELTGMIDNAIEKLMTLGNMNIRPYLDASGITSACDAIVSACNSAISALNRLSSSGGGGGFGGGHAAGGWMDAGTTYLVGELGPELVTPTRSGYVHTAEETAGILGSGGGITINIQGDVYDDERSFRQKLENAITSVMHEQVAYG